MARVNFSLASGGLITTGLDGHITLVNTAAQKLLERPENELRDQPVHQLFLDPLPLASHNARTSARQT